MTIIFRAFQLTSYALAAFIAMLVLFSIAVSYLPQTTTVKTTVTQINPK